MSKIKLCPDWVLGSVVTVMHLIVFFCQTALFEWFSHIHQATTKISAKLTSHPVSSYATIFQTVTHKSKLSLMTSARILKNKINFYKKKLYWNQTNFLLWNKHGMFCDSFCAKLYSYQWRILAVCSVWSRIITSWIIRVGIWITSFSCQFVWWSSRITFLHFFHPQYRQA